MAEKTLDVKILNRIDTIANWDAQNPRPRLGEICIGVLDETDSDTGTTTRTYKMKVGDGATDWSNLPYVYYTQPEIDSMLVSDGASATKVSFSNDNFTSKNVAAALVELYGLAKGIETNVKELNDEAYEISYSASKSGLTDYTNVQQILDYITDYLQNYVVDADDVVYENTTSNFKDATTGLAIDNVQEALDYTYNIIPKNATGLTYSNIISGMTATNVQSAIDELDTRLDSSEKASGISFSTTNTTGKLSKTNVQDVLEELLGYVDALEASDIAYTDTPAGGTQNTYVKGTEVQTALDNIEATLTDIYAYGVSKELSSFSYDNTKTKIQADDADSTIYDTLNAQQVLEYVINKFTTIKQNLAGAVSVTFDNTNTNIIAGTDVQVALEQLDTQVKTNKDDIAALTASDIDYVNITSGSIATNVQAELDILDSRLDASEAATGVSYDDSVTALGTNINTVQKAIEILDGRLDDSEKSTGVSYDDSVSLMGTAAVPINTVQKAIEKLDSRLDVSEKADGVSYDDTLYSIGETNVQNAIDDTIGRVKDTEELIADWDDATLSKFSTSSDGDLMFGTIKIGGTDDTFHKYASEISYDDAAAAMGTATDPIDTVQKALDKLDSRVDAIEGWDATNISYDDTTSAMSTSTNTVNTVQKAIESIDSKLDTLELKAEKVSYVNITSGMAATNVQAGIDELDSRLDNLTAADVAYTESGASTATTVKAELDKVLAWTSADISFDDTTAGLSTDTNTVDNVKSAIEALDARLDSAEANKNSADDISYDNNKTSYSWNKTTVQGALDLSAQVYTILANQIPNNAEDIEYDDSNTDTGADNVQEALETAFEKISDLNEREADSITYTTADTDSSALTSTNVRDALDEVNNKLDTIAANKNTADDVTYDKTKTTKSVNAETVQDAIDVLAASISTTDGKISNESKDIKYDNTTAAMSITPADATFGITVQEAIDKLDSRLDTVEGWDAGDITYSNTTSGLTATDTQSAIDEVVTKLGTIELKAEKVSFAVGTGDNDLKSTTVQAALEEVNGKLDTIAANKNTATDITYDGTTSGISAINVQAAIDATYGAIPEAATDIEYTPASGSTVLDTTVQSVIDTLVTRTDTIPTKIEELSYDKTKKNLLTATDGQAAIDELAGSIDSISKDSSKIAYDPTYATIDATNVQDAIDALDTKYQTYTGAKAEYVEYNPSTSGRTNNVTVQGAIDKAFAEIDQMNADFTDNATGIKYENTSYPAYDTVAKALNVLFDDVLFEPPKIETFTVAGYTPNVDGEVIVEYGTSIASLTFNWTLSGATPTQIILTGCSPAATDLTATYSTTLTADKTFTLVIQDVDGNTDTKSITFKFVNKIYYGSAAEPATYDSAFVLGLSNNSYSTTSNFNINITVASSQYGYVVLPYTVTELYICNMPCTFELCSTISLTNSSGGVSTYYIYRTYQTGLGLITIEKK